MENTLKDEVLSLRVDEISLRSRIVEKLRVLDMGQRATREFCENELGYTAVETRSMLALLGYVLTSEQMISNDPAVQLKIDRLREWRSQRARREVVPAYRVLTNRVIMSLASECPRDVAGLRGVKGFGEKLASQYGTELVELLK